ncbi:cysteine desulfurase DndA [Brevibacillus dissolubilis]|uniref:cysteine desulfurase DndA n=1 Tax=Brevibacillus dissolubilis TaxID=1844116 RepID=UPI0011169D98|nr:cysteine desulfurase DndA [Brevibacillus dissolubilis]
MTIYLDYNATTPVHPEVLDEMFKVYRENYGNASSRTHTYGHQAKQLVDQARKTVAQILDITPTEVVFTSGATESNNLAIQGLAKWGKENGKMHIVSTSIEHSAVLEVLEHLSQRGFEIEYISPDSSGRVKAQDVLERVRPDTLLVTVMHANNETGIIQPVQEIGQALMQTETFFHVDAAQTFGKLVDELKELPYDLLSVTAHKLYGPQGIGALVIRQRRNRRIKLEPLMYGGGQERGVRPGTLPVALIVGFGKAVELAQQNYQGWMKAAGDIKESIMAQLTSVQYAINGDQKYCLPQTLNISFIGVDSEALMVAVKNQMAISSGSACTSSSYEPSHVIMAMGGDAESAIRLSWGPGSEVRIAPIVDVVRSFQ